MLGKQGTGMLPKGRDLLGRSRGGGPVASKKQHLTTSDRSPCEKEPRFTDENEDVGLTNPKSDVEPDFHPSLRSTRRR